MNLLGHCKKAGIKPERKNTIFHGRLGYDNNCAAFWQNVCRLPSYGGPTVRVVSGPVPEITSLLRRLQAHTLSDEVPPLGIIHPFTKMAVTFEPLL